VIEVVQDALGIVRRSWVADVNLANRDGLLVMEVGISLSDNFLGAWRHPIQEWLLVDDSDEALLLK